MTKGVFGKLRSDKSEGRGMPADAPTAFLIRPTWVPPYDGLALVTAEVQSFVQTPIGYSLRP